ncbi:MAG: sigma-70 family RNA polymerase sigma factor [Planctomycetes bacterium]|nr:sigma-70 family RNA polymerase sigma factor [Planctomycetota bacterium]
MSAHGPSEGVPIEVLLTHREWVRALARSLYVDRNDADDLEQETWRMSLERPPRHAKSLRAWLAKAVRNAAISTGRKQRIRGTREAEVVPRVSTPTPADSVAAAELMARIAHAVVQLDEPYRTTVVLRYYEGLEASEIAAQLSTPVETVRTRLKRALAELRRRLAGEDENRRSWALLIFGTSRERSRSVRAASAVTAAGGALMVKKVVVAAVVAAIIAAGIVAAGLLPKDLPSRGDVIAASPGAPPRPRVRVTSVDGTEAVAPAPPAAARPACSVAVRDALTRRPIAGAMVFVDVATDEVAGASDSTGISVVDLPENAEVHSVVVAAPGYTSAEARRTDDGFDAALWPTRLERSGHFVTGVVLGIDGVPVVGAPVVGRGLNVGRAVAVTEADGRFRIDVPWNVWLLTLTTRTTQGAALSTVRFNAWDSSGQAIEPSVVLRLGTSRRVRVVVNPDDSRAQHRLVATPMAEMSAAQRGHEWPVSSGDEIDLPIGAWRLELSDGTTRIAPPRIVYCQADGARTAKALFPEEEHEQVYEPTGSVVDSVTFDVDQRVVRFHVHSVTDGAAVAGVRVVAEDAAAADPWVPRFEEYSDERYHATMLTGARTPARRAPPHLRIDALTDGRGIAETHGWFPVPAVVSVEGAFVVPSPRTVEKAEVESGKIDLRVQLGGRVDVRLPAMLTECLLEEMTSHAILLFSADQPARAVPAGTWRLRLARLPDRTTEEAVLAAPFALAVGETRVIDLTDLAPRVTDVLHLARIASRPDACARDWFEHHYGARDGFRRMEGGEARFACARVNCDGFRRYEIHWMESGCAHVHVVNVGGGADVVEPVTLVHELEYESGALILDVSGLLPGTSLRIITKNPKPGQIGLDFHDVVVPREATAAGTLLIGDLPVGGYWISVDGPGHRTCDPTELDVSAQGVARVSVRVEDLSLSLELDGVDPCVGDGVGFGGRIELLPSGADDPRTAIQASSWKRPRAEFRRVPPGNYRLRVFKSGPMRRENGMDYMSYVLAQETSISVPDSARDKPLRVDLR